MPCGSIVNSELKSVFLPRSLANLFWWPTNVTFPKMLFRSYCKLFSCQMFSSVKQFLPEKKETSNRLFDVQ